MKLRILMYGFAWQIFAGAAMSSELPVELRDLGLREATVASRDLEGWKVPGKIVVQSIFGIDVVNLLQPVALDAQIIQVASAADAARAIGGAQVFIGFCSQEVLAAASQLLWLHHYFAGAEECFSLPELQSGDITLTNGQRLPSPAVADHTIAMMYALIRGLDSFHGNQARGEWNPQSVQTHRKFGEVSGRTILIIGLGSVGSHVAKKANSLGMRVLATRSSSRTGPSYVEYVGLANEALELAQQADVVVNTAPLTDATRGMFDKNFFAAMKSSAYFINMGRGQSTVTDDLVVALRNKQIAGAALDVTDPEPLPTDHELWRMPRVLITPHTAGQSGETIHRLKLLVVENLRRYVAGEPLLSILDTTRGY
jgi:phosphoglycerate dehydrogenase-like enzyme